MFARRGTRVNQLFTQRQQRDLRLAGAFQVVNLVEGLHRALLAYQQPVVVQQHGRALSQTSLQALALFVGEIHPFVMVPRQPVGETHRVLGQWQQSALHRRDGNAGRRVAVHDVLHIGSRHVHRAVDGEAARVDAHAGRVLKNIAVDIHLHQA